MNKQLQAHIRKAGYVLKGLNNPERLKIISLLQKQEMTAGNLTSNLRGGKRETLRHLQHLIDIKVVLRERGREDMRMSIYTLNEKIFQNYITCIAKMSA